MASGLCPMRACVCAERKWWKREICCHYRLCRSFMLAICKIKPTTKKLPSATIHSKSTNKLIKAEAGESSIFGFYLSSVASYSQQRDTLGFVCLAIFSFFFGQTNYAARSLNRDTQAQLGEFSLSRPSLPFVRANMLTSIWLSSSSSMLPLKLKHDKTIPSNFLCWRDIDFYSFPSFFVICTHTKRSLFA